MFASIGSAAYTKKNRPGRLAAPRPEFGRTGGRLLTRSPDQKFNLSANWIWRMEFAVPRVWPKFEGGAAPEPPPQLMLVGLYKFTWLGALNISMRNSRLLCSVIGNSLMTEASSVPRHGPLRVLRPQLPNVPATGLENAAGFHQPFWLGLGSTGSTPAVQFSRVALVTKLVPPESHADVLTTLPLCSVVMVLNCQLPTTWFTIPPWLRNFWPLPNGSV